MWRPHVAPAIHLGWRMGPAQSAPNLGDLKATNKRLSRHKLGIRNWNIFSLLNRERPRAGREAKLCFNNALCVMNAFFQHRDMPNYTWCRDYLGQRSLIDFCIASTYLFRSVLDVRVQNCRPKTTCCIWKSYQSLHKRVGLGDPTE